MLLLLLVLPALAVAEEAATAAVVQSVGSDQWNWCSFT